MMWIYRLRLPLLTLAAALVAGPLFAQESASEEKSLDQQLLEGLGDDLLEGLGPPPQPKSQPKSEAAGGEGVPPPDTSLDEELLKSLTDGEDLGSQENPLERIRRQMRASQQLLAERRSGESTQKLQDRIVTDLAALLEQAQQQKQQASQSSSSQKPEGGQPQGSDQAGTSAAGDPQEAPAQESTEDLRQQRARGADLSQMQRVLDVLRADLPERTREQMLNTSFEQFLPKYEVLIEKYYKRLAAEPAESP